MLAAHGNLTVVKLLSIHNATLLTAYLSVVSSKIFYVLMFFFMVALWNRETIYIFMLWFVLLLSSSSFFSSPNLSRRRLDVCHTSTHGVALVRI